MGRHKLTLIYFPTECPESPLSCAPAAFALRQSQNLYTTLVIKDWNDWNKMLPNISRAAIGQVKTLITRHALANLPLRGKRPHQTCNKTEHSRLCPANGPARRGSVKVLESNDFVVSTPRTRAVCSPTPASGSITISP